MMIASTGVTKLTIYTLDESPGEIFSHFSNFVKVTVSFSGIYPGCTFLRVT